MLLTTLQSPSKSSGAIAYINSDEELIYIQEDSGSSLVRLREMRGLSVVGDRCYVTTAASLRIYEIRKNIGNGLLGLLDEIIMPEWIMGGRTQADLLPVVVSKTRKRVFVGCNRNGSIYEFDLDGRFILRRYLWDISPELFTLPSTMGRNFRYGHIRSIAESPSGDIWITIAKLSNGESGAVVNLDTGRTILSGLNTPHGGVFYDCKFYILDVAGGVLSAYKTDESGALLSSLPVWQTKPILMGESGKSQGNNLRGLDCVNDVVYCGLCRIKDPAGKVLSPRIVKFDATTGAFKGDVSLENVRMLKSPRVFSLHAMNSDILSSTHAETIFFRDGFVNQRIFEEVEAQKKLEEVEAQRKLEEAEAQRKLEEAEAQRKLEEVDNGCEDDSGGQRDYPVLPGSSEIGYRPEAIIVNNVSLGYQRTGQSMLGFNRNLRSHKEFKAIKNVSFTIKEGEVVGLIGKNGSGKSTMGMLICQTLIPDSGEVRVYGKVQLLALGVGFRKELTGRENAIISGTLLGLSRKEMKKNLDAVEQFSEIGEFFDEPVRTYSSGMRSRLAFAVATVVKPDILVLDEVLSTGDRSFRGKAQARMKDMQDKIKTIVIVSHSSEQLKKMCSRILWLEQGHLIMDGKPKRVLSEYEKFSKSKDKWLALHGDIASLLEHDTLIKTQLAIT